MKVTVKFAPFDGPAAKGLESHPGGRTFCTIASGIRNARLVRASP